MSFSGRSIQTMPFLLLVALLAGSHTSFAYDRTGHVIQRDVLAPGTKLIRPDHRVAVVCDACDAGGSHPPRWLLILGSGLNLMSLEAVTMKSLPPSSTADGNFVAILDGRKNPSPAPPALQDRIVPFTVPTDQEAIEGLKKRVGELVAPDPVAPSIVRYLFIVNRESEADRVLHAQASWAAHYAKLDADYLLATDIDRVPVPWLRRYSVVVLATETVPRTQAARLANGLSDFLDHGGGVVALAGVYDELLLSVFQVRPSGKARAIHSISCDGSWLPGATGLNFALSPDWKVQMYPFEPDAQARVLCRGLTENGDSVPMSFAADRGSGRVVFWQSGQLADKSARGLILLSILEASKVSVAAVLNALVFWMDDCPMPMWNARIPPMDSLYDMTDVEFYQKIWWPRMTSLFERYRLRPSFGFILSYDDRVKPPFASMYKGPEDPAAMLAGRILEAGHEVALHGYNHQSLTVARKLQSRGWPGRSEMLLALRAAREGMIDILGPDSLPTAYVAPNNLLQKLGKEAVREVFPEITSMASQYLDEEAIVGQEFGPDPDLPGITNIPRISSEYFLDSDNGLEVLSALVTPGVLSHFIHPDDNRDPERSRGKEFDKLLLELESLLDRVLKAYPFLRRMTATAFASKVREHARTKMEVVRGAGSLVIRAPGSSIEGLTTVVRVAPGMQPNPGDHCFEVYRAPEEGRYYYRVGEEPCIIGF